MKISKLICYLGFISLISNFTLLTQAASSPATNTMLTIAAGVRVRSEPNTSAKEVARLQIGTLVKELDKSAQLEQLNQANDYWYRVELADGKKGWIFGSFIKAIAANHLAQAYQELADSQLQLENQNFADLVDLTNFLARVSKELTSTNDIAELKLRQLLALQRSLKVIPIDKQTQPTYKKWLQEQQANVVYSEPSAEWLVKADLFWTLEKKYHATPIAEKMAWAGAQTTLPGECEGDLACHLNSLGMTMGKYVNLYPEGAHIAEALDYLIKSLQLIVKNRKSEIILDLGDENTVSEEELQTAIRALRVATTKTSNPKKMTILKLLDNLAKQ